ncbi:teichoic acids export ABC transporter ATP-binding subunit TagH [Neobacillus notoginsengisoli]|nr:teichoic acids export ABC transporter ATP-binding subunit TagH [Neobacillus notoginsengisoli]
MMDKKPKVVFKNVYKRYSLIKSNKLMNILSLKKNEKSFYALRDISFEVYEGETVGVIGINGSGKSTLSNLLAEVVPPSSGKIEVDGETSLIAISVGLNNNLTGLENIELKCLMHGMKKDEIKKITPCIIDFADLGDFIYQPVKNYSSGMRSRLGFAISAHTNPDVMVVDEALSVGDQTFYQKCITKMNEFKAQGKTIFFISHSAGQIRSFCDKAIWVHYGAMVDFGESEEVLEKYNQFIKWFNSLSEEEKKQYKTEKLNLQYAEEDDLSYSSKSRLSSKKKKYKLGNIRDFTLFLSLFLFSIVVLFSNNIHLVGAIKNVINKPETPAQKTINKDDNKEITSEKIDKTGFINSEVADIFVSSDLKQKVNSLDFMKEVFVEESFDNSFLISYAGLKGYVHKEDIWIPSGEPHASSIDPNYFLPAFPDSFRVAYEYYLVFVNEEKELIESKVRGKTGERTDKFNNQYISYGPTEYRINPDTQESDAILVNELALGLVNLEEILSEATHKSNNGELYFFLNDKYKMVLNINDRSLLIEPNNENGES